MTASMLVKVLVDVDDQGLAVAIAEGLGGDVRLFHVRRYPRMGRRLPSMSVTIETECSWTTQEELVEQAILAAREYGYRKSLSVQATNLDRAEWTLVEVEPTLRLVRAS